MITHLPFWRFVAWIGVMWIRLKVGKEEGVVRWQDKTGAVGVGGDARFSANSSASHANPRLAAMSGNDAFQPITERLRGIW